MSGNRSVAKEFSQKSYTPNSKKQRQTRYSGGPYPLSSVRRQTVRNSNQRAEAYKPSLSTRWGCGIPPRGEPPGYGDKIYRSSGNPSCRPLSRE